MRATHFDDENYAWLHTLGKVILAPSFWGSIYEFGFCFFCKPWLVYLGGNRYSMSMIEELAMSLNIAGHNLLQHRIPLPQQRAVCQVFSQFFSLPLSKTLNFLWLAWLIISSGLLKLTSHWSRRLSRTNWSSQSSPTFATSYVTSTKTAG